jgi:hypothetical protein
LTDKRKAAEAKAEQTAATLRAEREALDQARREAAELRAKYEPPKTDELGPEPTPSQFQDISEYSAALKEWAADKAMRDQQAKQADDQQKARAAQVAKDWGERLKATQAEIPDYAEKIEASPVKVSDQVRDAILESEIGPKLIYHLAEHPEVAEKLGKLSVQSALRELGRIEGSLMQPVKEPAIPAKAEISKAPAPITPLRGSNSPTGPQLDGNNEFHGTYQQWKAARKAGKIK